MDGSSRGALKAGRDQLAQQLGQTDAKQLADDLFFVGRTLDSSAALRRALVDPSRDTDAKRQLGDRLFAGKVGDAARQVLGSLVGQRWSAERDMSDAVDLLGAEAVTAAAEQAGRLGQVEQELFQIERLVAGTPELRDALTNRQRGGQDKADLVGRLLDGKAAPETVQLARLAAFNPRGQRFDQAIERYQGVAAQRREQLVALVSVAQPLSPDLAERLEQALSRTYSKPVQLNVVIDPDVVGGLRVQVGDEVIDGSVARRLDDARRALAG